VWLGLLLGALYLILIASYCYAWVKTKEAKTKSDAFVFISVIVPARNEEKNIERCLKSLQGIVDEIVIVDSFSKDKTEEVVMSINDDRIHYIKNETNQERCISRNSGIEKSKGKYICFLDSDLSDDQIERIKKKIYKIIKSYPIEAKYKNLIGKDYENLFLPEYFPEFDKYIHIDADAWVNSWSAIEYLIKACDDGKIGVTSMGDRKIDKVTKINWIFKGVGALKSQNFKHSLKKGFAIDIAREVGLSPHINGGVFSLEKKSEFWKIWRKNFDKCIKVKPIYGSDQLALNLSVYIDKFPADFLPHHCNWLPNPRNIIFK
jgi:glycosyltransferase involved in cell wall biosynthesis